MLPHPDSDSSPSAESLFARELAKRGMVNGATTPTSSREWEDTTPTPSRNPFERPLPTGDASRQFQKSRALASEGLEGFIPRATELIKLGFMSTAAFAPWILIVALATMTVSVSMGDKFIHGGKPDSIPEYIDPDALLAEESMDGPTVPLNPTRPPPRAPDVGTGGVKGLGGVDTPTKFY